MKQKNKAEDNLFIRKKLEKTTSFRVNEEIEQIINDLTELAQNPNWPIKPSYIIRACILNARNISREKLLKLISKDFKQQYN